MKVQAPFRLVQRIPPYRKHQMWNKRLKMMVYGCQRNVTGGNVLVMTICFHWTEKGWKWKWAGGGDSEASHHFLDEKNLGHAV